MVRTIKQVKQDLTESRRIEKLKEQIASQEKKISKEQLSSKRTSEIIELQSKLFKLKRRKFFVAGDKAKRLSKKFGKGILAAGKKIAPVIQKQAKLIRDQQLRDDAIARARSKKVKKKVVKKKKKSIPRSDNSFGVFGNLDF